NSAPSGMTMRTVGLLISDGVGDVGTLAPSDQWGRLPRVTQGVSRLGPGEAPRVAHVGPDVRLDVREDLPMVVAIVVDPLRQEVRDGEPTHGGMAAGPTEIAVVEPIDEGGARLADARPLAEEAGGIPVAVPAVSGDRVLVPGPELGVGLGEERPDPAREAAL